MITIACKNCQIPISSRLLRRYCIDIVLYGSPQSCCACKWLAYANRVTCLLKSRGSQTPSQSKFSVKSTDSATWLDVVLAARLGPSPTYCRLAWAGWDRESVRCIPCSSDSTRRFRHSKNPGIFSKFAQVARQFILSPELPAIIFATSWKKCESLPQFSLYIRTQNVPIRKDIYSRESRPITNQQ